MARRDEPVTDLDRLAREAVRTSLSRRGFLLGAAGLGTVGAGGFLAACGSGGSSTGGPSGALPKADATENVVSAVPQPEKMAQVQPVDTTVAGMRWPVRGKVISNFGGKPNGLKNEGINISVPEGTSIRAADGGVVAYAGNELRGYGNLVLVKHANGFITAYAHCDELLVKQGDKVNRGQAIAKVGATGGVSEPQLHFELRRGKKAVDPREFLTPAPSAGEPSLTEKADRQG